KDSWGGHIASLELAQQGPDVLGGEFFGIVAAFRYRPSEEESAGNESPFSRQLLLFDRLDVLSRLMDHAPPDTLPARGPGPREMPGRRPGRPRRCSLIATTDRSAAGRVVTQRGARSAT